MLHLRTERLALAPFTAEDGEELLALFTDPDVRRWLLDDSTVSRAWVDEEVSASETRFADDGDGLWSIREIGHPPIIGFVGYRPFFDPPEVQLLYGFLPAAWGRGFATEAAAEAVRYGFEDLGFDEVRAATDVPNAASIRVLERLGMREWRRSDDGPHGTLYFRVTRQEWAGATSRRRPEAPRR